MFTVVGVVMLLTLSACMTPRQTEALAVLQDAYTRGLFTTEQFEILAAALSPTAWVQDVITIGSGLFGGVGAYVATNIHRDKLRRVRGEPVKPA